MEVYHDGEFWCAKGIGQDIFTQGRTVDEVYQNIKEAVATHFENGSEPVENDILARVGLWNNIPKEELLERLREKSLRADSNCRSARG